MYWLFHYIPGFKKEHCGLQQPTVQEPSPSSLPVLLQYYFHFPQTNSPSLLAGKAEKREGKEGRELRNYSANHMLMEKKTTKEKDYL